MKTVVQFKEMSPQARATSLKSLCTRLSTARKEIVKVLVAAEETGDYGKGEMNSYAQRITGIELRREAQGTYESVNVLKGIRQGAVPMTEAEFDSKKFGSFPLIMLSGFMSKSPEKVIPALEIIRSGEDVTKRLKALRGGKPAASGDAAPETPGSQPEIQMPSANETPAGHTYFVPEGASILACPDIQSRILHDIRHAPTGEDCMNYFQLLSDLAAQVQTRLEHIEAETQNQKPAKPAAA